MKYNPDEFNVLPLSDYEKGYLTAVYNTLAEPEAKEYHNDNPEENSWFMEAVGERTFDLCTYLSDESDITSDKVCIVYEAHPDVDGMGNPTGTYSTDTTLEYYLKEVA